MIYFWNCMKNFPLPPIAVDVLMCFSFSNEFIFIACVKEFAHAFCTNEGHDYDICSTNFNSFLNFIRQQFGLFLFPFNIYNRTDKEFIIIKMNVACNWETNEQKNVNVWMNL